ncbi:hypothetical protein HEK616_62740 [Streptomyces nigrescens]|uniref:Uncharacterized protein n=2 Tax=Streptomyces TaxID=1883 RepID=A0ABM8A2H3_STRNI|nr:hypothetical protein [Streptomyces nigrescens]BDM72787.1 hypothetical protein HEK616_62740 [Streptomyces nigrescens]
MAGIPGILVARVSSGAQVMTVTGSRSPEFPTPGREPQPESSDAMAAVHVTAAAIVTAGAWGNKGRGEERRRPVMAPQPSVLPGTPE